MHTHLRPRLFLCFLLLGACTDGRPTEPGTPSPQPDRAISISGDPAFYFLPPMVPDPGPFTGTFDGNRSPVVRVVCTAATGPTCPLVASFGGAGEPAIKVDLEGNSYGVVWHAPSSLTLGSDMYRLEVYDGTDLLGSADLWAVSVRQELATVAEGYVGLVRGSPLPIKFRIETGANLPAVAVVDVTPTASSVLTGATVQLSAVTKDANDNVLANRPISWTSSNAAVATVSASGLVTTLTPGTTTITATSEGVSDNAAIESVDPTYIPAFQRPFSVGFEVQTTNYHDHNEPREFVDANGVYLPYWGEPSLMGIDGHEGYDWRLPIGTPLTAVAAGQVIAATLTGPSFFCPVLGATVSNSSVVLQHTLPGGVTVRTAYVHVDQINVQPGDQVSEGQVIATSGNRGCSLNPHLHFAVYRLTQTNDGTISPIDPYGWSGQNVDPWTLDAEGAPSIWLWKTGEAPSLFRSVFTPLGETPGPFVQITRVRFQGVRDDQNPNNEYIEVTRDGRTAAPDPLDISNFTLTTKAGLVYTFPSGTLLTAASPTARVYIGSGTNASGTLYWGQSSGVLDNLAECVRFKNSAGVLRNQAGWGGGCLSP